MIERNEILFLFFFSSRRRHTRSPGDWSSDVCSSDLLRVPLISDSDGRVPADGGQESQASSWVEAWNSAGLSSCPRGERPLVELYLEPGGFSGRCTGESLPLRVDFIHRVDFGEVSGHRVLIKRGPGNRGASQRGSTHEATSGMSSRDRPHPEVRPEGREPLLVRDV